MEKFNRARRKRYSKGITMLIGFFLIRNNRKWLKERNRSQVK